MINTCAEVGEGVTEEFIHHVGEGTVTLVRHITHLTGHPVLSGAFTPHLIFNKETMYSRDLPWNIRSHITLFVMEESSTEGSVGEEGVFSVK